MMKALFMTSNGPVLSFAQRICDFTVYLTNFVFIDLDDLAVVGHQPVDFILNIGGLGVNGTGHEPSGGRAQAFPGRRIHQPRWRVLDRGHR